MRGSQDQRDYWTIFWLSIAGGVCLGPFVFYHLIQGNWFLLIPAVCTWFVLLAMAMETWIYRRVPVRSLFAFAVIASFSLLLAIYLLELPGALWSFPVITFMYYLLGTRLASYIMFALFPGIVLVASFHVEAAIVPRLTITLAFTWFVAFVFSANIDRQRLALENMAYIDPLTGARNRREMTAEMRSSVYIKGRYGTSASLLILDIDYFKSINDSHGHQTGDQVLIDLTRYLKERLRKSDHLFRAGGEEFLILLPETELDQAQKLARELVGELPTEFLGGVEHVTVSLGVAELNAGETPDDWFSRADRALYRAKAKGRDRVEVAA